MLCGYIDPHHHTVKLVTTKNAIEQRRPLVPIARPDLTIFGDVCNSDFNHGPAKAGSIKQMYTLIMMKKSYPPNLRSLITIIDKGTAIAIDRFLNKQPLNRAKAATGDTFG